MGCWKKEEKIVSHELKVSDLQVFQVLFQPSKWFIVPINHRNVPDPHYPSETFVLEIVTPLNRI